MSQMQRRLDAMGLTLPEVAPALADYVPWVREGGWVWISGQLPIESGRLLAEGRVPAEVSPERAAQAARQCALNAVAALGAALAGRFEDVQRIVQVTVYVQSEAGFGGQPEVANGASELIGGLWGEAGRHSRIAVGAHALPRNAPVELALVAAVSPG